MAAVVHTHGALTRALSPVPSRLVFGALVVFFLGERVLGGDDATLYARLLAGALFLAAVGLQWAGSRGGPEAARRYSFSVLLTYGGLACGASLYAVHVFTAGGSDDKTSGYALIGALVVLLTHTAVLIAVELTGDPMRAAGFVEMRRVKQAAATAASLSFAFAGLALLNVAAAKVEWRKDLSFAAPTSPTAATLSLLEASSREVEVFLFFEKGSPVLNELGDYFEGLEAKGAKRRVLDQALDAELAKELKVSRNGTVAFRSGERSESWYVGTERDAARRKMRSIDDEVRKRLSKLTRDAKNIHFTVGHGEREDKSTSGGERPGAANFAKIAKALNAKVTTLGLKDGLGSTVPDKADVVVVHGPTSAFLPGEVEALKRYAEGGGALLLLLDPEEDHGLAPVLEVLGLQAPGKTLLNDQEFVRRSHTEADHAFLFAASFASHKSVKALNDARGRAALLFFRAGELERRADTDAKVTFIARSRKGTFRDENGNGRFDEGEERKVRDFAAAVERPIEDKPELRAIVVADSDVLSDTLVAAEANAAFGYEALLWLLRDDAAGGGALELDEDVPILHTRDSDSLWFYGSTVMSPALVLLFGLLFVKSRRKRRTS
jgi:hypothetical protein